MQDRRNMINRKASAAVHYALWHYLSKMIKPVLVAEYPKSGGTWYCQMLAHYLQLPYPRNHMPALKKSVLHSHYTYSSSFFKPHCVVRDGRDVMVSYYHHMYFGNSILPEWVFEYYRTRAPFKDFENVEKNMPAYIEYMFTKHMMQGKVVTWKSFLHSYLDKPSVTFVKYEDLLEDREKWIRYINERCHINSPERIIRKTVEKTSFETMSGRNHGVEDAKSHQRKGISGDWKNHFTEKHMQIFREMGGEEFLRSVGYSL